MTEPELAAQGRERLEATGRVLCPPAGHIDIDSALRALARGPDGQRALARLLEAETAAAQAEAQRTVLDMLYGRPPDTGARSAFVTRRLRRLGPFTPLAQRLLDASLPGKRLLRHWLTVSGDAGAAGDARSRATRLWS